MANPMRPGNPVYDPVLPSHANNLLKEHGLRPVKRLGQNFLVDRNVANRIVGAAALQSGERVLEIGPGLGALTLALAAAATHVTAVEVDRKLEPVLNHTLADLANVTVVYADFLKMDHAAQFAQAFGGVPGVVIANIPYYITTPILQVLIAHRRLLRCIVLLVQREVAERLCARADTPAYGSLSVYAQYHARVEIAGYVPPSVFLPPPDVTSAIAVLHIRQHSDVEMRAEGVLFAIVRAAFGKRRKTLLNALQSLSWLDRSGAQRLLAAAGIDPIRRGETLNLAEFCRLADTAAGMYPDAADYDESSNGL